MTPQQQTIQSILNSIANQAFTAKEDKNLIRLSQFKDKKNIYYRSFKTSLSYEFKGHIFTKMPHSEKPGKIAHELKQINDPLFVMKLVNVYSEFFNMVHENSDFSFMATSKSGTLNKVLDLILQLRYDRKATFSTRSTAISKRKRLAKQIKKILKSPEILSSVMRYVFKTKYFEVHKLPWRIREIPEMDQLYIHKVPKTFINKLIQFEKEHGYKPTVFLFDDSVSNAGLTFRMLVNQIAPYANVIVVALFYEGC